MKTTKLLFAAALCVAVFGVSDIAAKGKRDKKGTKTEAEAGAESKPETPYSRVFKDKKYTTEKGLVTIHNVEGKVYLEFPLELLGRRMITGAMVESVSDPLESSVGVQPTPPSLVFFDRTDSLVLIRKPDEGYMASGEENIGDALAKSHIPAIVHTFPIIAPSPDSTALLFEATSLFLRDAPSLNPLDPKAYNAMEGYVARKGTYSSSNSMIEGIAAFDDNFSVTSKLSYKIKSALLGIFSSGEDAYLTADVRTTFMLLPGEPMSRREADSRIGTDVVRNVEYSDGQRGGKAKYYATRLRMEPVDAAAFSKGEPVGVKKPMVFFIDPNFPESWLPYIYKSIEEWNRTFEAIGFKDALQAKPFPADDTEFNPANIKYSCIRYAVSPVGTIVDNKWSDPRTGEIISANIFVNHGVQETIQRNRFLQTAAADPDARGLELSGEELGEGLCAMLMRNIGHCIGLSDNMAASFAFPADSLTSAEFTSNCGISSSVMDELPYNFIASAANHLAGARLVQTTPGLYDYYAVKWLYSPASPQELTAMIEAHRNDAAYYFGKRQSSKVFYDPRAMAFDLSDDVTGSVGKGMLSLADVIANADSWLDAGDYDYQYRRAFYDNVVMQIYEYVKQVFVNVGGIYINEKYEGDTAPTYISVPKEVQRDCLLWIMKQISDLSWLEEKNLNSNAGLLGSVSDFCEKYFTQFIFIQIDAMWLSESKSDDQYTQIDAARDVTDFIWRDAASGREPGELMKYQQSSMVDNLISWSGVKGTTTSAGKSSGKDSSVALNRAFEVAGMAPLTEIRYETTPERRHEWYGLLLETRKIALSAASAARSEDARNHYRYLVYKIDSALKTD